MWIHRGSAIAKIVGANAKQQSSFTDRVTMYVYEEIIDGRKLTEIINETHENVKYLPGHKIPENVVRLHLNVYTNWHILQDDSKSVRVFTFITHLFHYIYISLLIIIFNSSRERFVLYFFLKFELFVGPQILEILDFLNFGFYYFY